MVSVQPCFCIKFYTYGVGILNIKHMYYTLILFMYTQILSYIFILAQFMMLSMLNEEEFLLIFVGLNFWYYSWFMLQIVMRFSSNFTVWISVISTH